jgi:hypothetical protein
MSTSSPLTPAQRRQRAQLANDIRWSRVPYPERAAQTASARQALWAKYLNQVDPDWVLPEAEREALARRARRGDMRRLALKSSRTRPGTAELRERVKAELARDPERPDAVIARVCGAANITVYRIRREMAAEPGTEAS